MTADALKKYGAGINAGVWAVAAVVMIFNASLAYELLRAVEVPKGSAWMLGPAVDVALCIALLGDRVLGQNGESTGWGRVLRWLTAALSGFLSTGTAWGIGPGTVNGPAVAVHLVPVLVLIALTEAAQAYQGAFARLIAAEAAEVRAAAQRRADAQERERRRVADERAATAAARQARVDAERAAEDARLAAQAEVELAQARAAEAAQLAEAERLKAAAAAAQQQAHSAAQEAQRRADEEAQAEAQRRAQEAAQRAEADRLRAEEEERLRRQNAPQPGTKEHAISVALDYRLKEGELPGPTELSRLSETSLATAKRALEKIRETPPVHLVRTTA